MKGIISHFLSPIHFPNVVNICFDSEALHNYSAPRSKHPKSPKFFSSTVFFLFFSPAKRNRPHKDDYEVHDEVLSDDVRTSFSLLYLFSRFFIFVFISLLFPIFHLNSRVNLDLKIRFNLEKNPEERSFTCLPPSSETRR